MLYTYLGTNLTLHLKQLRIKLKLRLTILTKNYPSDLGLLTSLSLRQSEKSVLSQMEFG